MYGIPFIYVKGSFFLPRVMWAKLKYSWVVQGLPGPRLGVSWFMVISVSPWACFAVAPRLWTLSGRENTQRLSWVAVKEFENQVTILVIHSG